MAKSFNFSLLIYYSLAKLLVTVKVIVLPACNLVTVVEIFLLDVIDVDYYFISSRGTKYCDDLVCMSVCLSARVSQKPRVQTSRNFLMCMEHVTWGRGSVLPGRE